MGEYADMAVDQALNEASAWDFPDYDDDTFDAYDGFRTPWVGRTRRRRGKTCQVCQKTGLRWGIDESDNWVLEEGDGSRHVCKFKGKFGAQNKG